MVQNSSGHGLNNKLIVCYSGLILHKFISGYWEVLQCKQRKLVSYLVIFFINFSYYSGHWKVLQCKQNKKSLIWSFVQKFFLFLVLTHKTAYSVCKITLDCILRKIHKSLYFSWIFRCNLTSLGDGKLTERAKFNVLEIQENFENYADKKERTVEVTIKRNNETSLKIYASPSIFSSIWVLVL